MAFTDMFTSGRGDGENSDKIFTKNGVKCKFMTGKQPIIFTILPALNPNDPNRETSWLPAILPTDPPTVSDWGAGAKVYRKLGRGEWKERYDIVSLASVGEECPVEIVRKVANSDPTWKYLTDDGKFGDPNRVPAVLPARRNMLFCNVFLPNEAEKVSYVGIFTSSLADKLVGEKGLVSQPNPSATAEEIEKDYLKAFANGDITNPAGAPVFKVEKGHDKGEMSAYGIEYVFDSSRLVQRMAADKRVMASRQDISDIRSYLNILSADQIVDILVRELTGYSPAGYHEYALLKIALGDRYRIPDPPSAPAATHTVQSGFAPQEAAKPASAQTAVQQAGSPAPAASPVAQFSSPSAEAQAPAAEAGAALAAAVAAGAAQEAKPATVTGDSFRPFSKEAFLAGLRSGGNK